jgi:hypothetical protein
MMGPFRYRVKRAIDKEPLVSVIGAGDQGFARLRKKTAYANVESANDPASARGDYLLFIADDAEPLDRDWLASLLEHAQRPEVGAVGGKLIGADGRLVFAGDPAFVGLPAAHPGEYGLPHVVRECETLSGACLMTKRSLYGIAAEGGFAADRYCRDVRVRGLAVLYTPYAALRLARPGGVPRA